MCVDIQCNGDIHENLNNVYGEIRHLTEACTMYNSSNPILEQAHYISIVIEFFFLFLRYS